MITQNTTLTISQRQRSDALNLASALRYPFQGQDWFNRLLILSLAQLLPVVGQLILLGYGVQVVRAVYAGQSDLPHIQWRRTLGDGLRVALAGLLYMMPVLLTGLLLVSSSSGGSRQMIIPVVILLSIIVAPMGSRLQKSGSGLLKVIGKLLTLTPLAAIVVSIGLGISSFVTAQHNPVPVSHNASDIGLPLIGGMFLLVFVILTGTLVGATRFAIENKSIFDAPGNLKMLLQHRKATGMLMLNLLVLLLITVVTTAVGSVLLIIPGLFMLVGCSTAVWHLLAQFGTQIGS